MWWYTHTTGWNSAIKRNKLPKRMTTCKDFEHITESDRSHITWFRLCGMLIWFKPIQTERRLVAFQGLGARAGINCKWAWESILFGGDDRNVLRLDCGDGCTTLHFPEVIALHTYSVWVQQYINHTLIRLLVKVKIIITEHKGVLAQGTLLMLAYTDMVDKLKKKSFT